MDVTIQTYQSFLDDANDAATAANPVASLRATMRGYEKTLTSLFSAGSISSVSKNSTSQSYRGPGLGNYTIAQLQTVWRDLINLFDRTKAWIDWARSLVPIPSWAPADDSDATIYGLMVKKLSCGPITEVTSDMTDFLLPPTLSPRGVTW